MTDDQYARLPLYARHEIDKLRHDVEHYRAAAMGVSAETTSIKYRTAMTWHHLPDNITVRFTLSEAVSRPEDWVDCRIEDGMLCVRGGNAMALLPRAANTIYVRREFHS